MLGWESVKTLKCDYFFFFWSRLLLFRFHSGPVYPSRLAAVDKNEWQQSINMNIAIVIMPLIIMLMTERL